MVYRGAIVYRVQDLRPGKALEDGLDRGKGDEGGQGFREVLEILGKTPVSSELCNTLIEAEDITQKRSCGIRSSATGRRYSRRHSVGARTRGPARNQRRPAFNSPPPCRLTYAHNHLVSGDALDFPKSFEALPQ